MAVEANFVDVLSRKDWLAFVATVEDKVAGYMVVFIREYQDNPFRHSYRALHIDQFGVLPEFRRQGIGTALLQKAEIIRAERNLQHLELSYWDTNNDAAEFYAASGFRPWFHFATKTENLESGLPR